MTDPYGTPAGQVGVVDSTPGSLTCWMDFFPSVVLLESFNHVCVMFTRSEDGCEK